MSKKYSINWLSTSKEGNYKAAQNYLSLLYPEEKAFDLVTKLRNAPIQEFQAKDILRASGLPLLDNTNKQVVKDTEKIENGIPLSPILLIRDVFHGKTIVADGFHRLVSIYKNNECTIINAKIISDEK